MAKTCQMCGQPSGKYPLCKEHHKMKVAGEIIQCPDCDKWHLATENCKCKPKYTELPTEGFEICEICGTATKGYAFCKKCWRKHTEEELLNILNDEKIKEESKNNYIIQKIQYDHLPAKGFTHCIVCNEETDGDSFCNKCQEKYSFLDKIDIMNTSLQTCVICGKKLNEQHICNDCFNKAINKKDFLANNLLFTDNDLRNGYFRIRDEMQKNNDLAELQEKSIELLLISIHENKIYNDTYLISRVCQDIDAPIRIAKNGIQKSLNLVPSASNSHTQIDKENNKEAILLEIKYTACPTDGFNRCIICRKKTDGHAFCNDCQDEHNHDRDKLLRILNSALRTCIICGKPVDDGHLCMDCFNKAKEKFDYVEKNFNTQAEIQDCYVYTRNKIKKIKSIVKLQEKCINLLALAISEKNIYNINSLLSTVCQDIDTPIRIAKNKNPQKSLFSFNFNAVENNNQCTASKENDSEVTVSADPSPVIKKTNKYCIVCGEPSYGHEQCHVCDKITRDFMDTLDKRSTPNQLRDYYYNLKEKIKIIPNLEEIKKMCNKLIAIAITEFQINNDSALMDHVYRDIEIITGNKFEQNHQVDLHILENQQETDKKESKNTTQDGHIVASEMEARIDDVLYNACILHCYGKSIDEILEQRKKCDWYIPITASQGIYIEYWGMNTYEYLKARKEKEALYQKYKIPYIGIEKDDPKKDSQGFRANLIKDIRNKAIECYGFMPEWKIHK